MKSATVQVPRRAIDVLSNAPNAALQVFLRICSLEDEDEASPTISSANLAFLTGRAQRTVFAALKQLEQLGVLQRERTTKSSANGYRLVVEATNPEAGAVARAVKSPTASPVVDDQHTALNGGSPHCERGSRSQDAHNPEGDAAASLDELITAVYSSRCRVNDIRDLVLLDDDELRAALEWLLSEGGVDPGMPVGFFAAFVRTAADKLGCHGPP